MLPWNCLGYLSPLPVVPQLHLLPQEQPPTPSQSQTGSAFPGPPGLSAPPGTPSHGSTLHGSGNCRPCAWFWKPGGCQNGKDCGHCHLCPEGEIKTRKKNKTTAMRLGLATPKPMKEVVDISAFFPRERSESVSEQDSTTCCSSPEQECLAPPSGSDEEGPSVSVIQCRDLEAALGSRSMTDSAGLPQHGQHAPPNTPSHGSAAHAAGTCKPCAWFWKPSGCQNAATCTYCHICSEGELKARKKSKHTAMRLGLVTPKVKPDSELEAKYSLNLAACI